MGMDFVALMKYSGPDTVVRRAIESLQSGLPPELQALVSLMKAQGMWAGETTVTVWEYHRPELFTDQIDQQPTLPDLRIALHVPDGFFLTFGSDAVEVYHLLRWIFFLTEPVLQRAMLDACSCLAKFFGTTDCLITSDFSPVIRAFREGMSFDASLAAAGSEDGERASLADLYTELPGDYIVRTVEDKRRGKHQEVKDWPIDKAVPDGWERGTDWRSSGYWRFPVHGGI